MGTNDDTVRGRVPLFVCFLENVQMELFATFLFTQWECVVPHSRWAWPIICAWIRVGNPFYLIMDKKVSNIEQLRRSDHTYSTRDSRKFGD